MSIFMGEITEAIAKRDDMISEWKRAINEVVGYRKQ